MIVVLFLSGYWLAGGGRPWLALLGFAFVAFPYHLLATGAHLLKFIAPQATDRQKWLCITLFNVAFLVAFAGFSTPAVTIWLAIMIVVAALCQLYLSQYPVTDVLSEGFVAAAPFMLGVLLGDHGQTMTLLPVAIIAFLWAVASHIIWQLAEHSEQVTVRLTSYVSRVGNEIAIMSALGMYVVAALLPVVYYGSIGIFAGLLFVLYALRVGQLLPIRFHVRNMLYVRTWWLVRRLNYLTLVVMLVYVVSGVA